MHPANCRNMFCISTKRRIVLCTARLELHNFLLWRKNVKINNSNQNTRCSFQFKASEGQQGTCIQLQKMNIIPLVNKPYLNEVILKQHILYLKSYQSSELKLCMLKRLRSFQRGTVSICRSIGIKVTSCQSWRFEKNSAMRPTLNHTRAAWVRFPDERIIL